MEAREFDDILLRCYNTVYNQNTIDRWTFSYVGWPRNCQELSRYNPYIHSSQDLQCNPIEPKIEKILWKKQNIFRRNRSTTSQFLTIRRILDVRAKNLKDTILFVDFTKTFNSIYWGKMGNVDYPFIAITLMFTLAQNDSTWQDPIYVSNRTVWLFKLWANKWNLRN